MSSLSREDDLEALQSDFIQAQRPIGLHFPGAGRDVLQHAQEAVRREYRDSVKWKRLRCRSVELVSESDIGTIYVLQVGHAVEFDWTWEGATAFRPLSISSLDADVPGVFPERNGEAEIDDSIVWMGEILEVDEAAGCIFVIVPDPEHPPTTGSFFVRPFEFLAFLNAIYNEPAFDRIREIVVDRLCASEGGIHPDVLEYRDVGLPELSRWWSKAWSVLWGPPGTGKTFTTGQQAVRSLADPSERILIVSTTNRATDAAAIALGKAAREVAPQILPSGALLRIGKGASFRAFAENQLEDMLRGTETEFLRRIERYLQSLARTTSSVEKAMIRVEIKQLRMQMRDAARRNFLDDEVRCVVATAFRATAFLNTETVKQSIEQGLAPFTTVFIDEAGLISRAATAALSLLAARRVVLVGDSKQLAPISRISRVLPTHQMTWLAKSGLSHLDHFGSEEAGVHVLRKQHRMHRDVCHVVSNFQYAGQLKTAPEVADRKYRLPTLLEDQPRAIWYVLDEEKGDWPSIRAERGPGNRSWVRSITTAILDRLLADADLRSCNGMFISPFKAQAHRIAGYLAQHELHTWSASTVHSQQGAEADVVIFDTVNAGSYSWPYDEWKRLVNVALSRAREAFLVLASRAEMQEPYLHPLLPFLSPRVLRKRGRKLVWEQVPAREIYSAPNRETVRENGAHEYAVNTNSLGYQISTRKLLRPVLSREQERLCGLTLDGKPRLVRGVAGSGKTIVLAHWLAKTVKRFSDQPDARIWAVFANRSLQALIANSIETAWDRAAEGTHFPWERVSLLHIREILDRLLPEVGLRASDFGFEYDDAAAAFLERCPAHEIQPACDALFIDEAQDMGPNTLKLLSALVRQVDGSDANSRAVNIFYDNAQNIYGRGTPRWSEFGLDLRGRSTVMNESFRSTKPIIEFALNVLYRLQPPENDPDHKELLSRGLVERTARGDAQWWTIRFNQIDGPKPTFRQFTSTRQEMQAVAQFCRELIEVEGVDPADICLLYNGQYIKRWLEREVAPRMAEIGVTLSVQTGRFERRGDVLLATTPHSFKGYDAEVVIVPGVDWYVSGKVGVLARNLYVAMTRARSMLALFAENRADMHAQRLYEVLGECMDILEYRPKVEKIASPMDDVADLVEIIGEEHRKWLVGLLRRYKISQEPLLTKSGEIIAQPLFWFATEQGKYACFAPQRPSQRVAQRLEDFGFKVIFPGDEVHP